MKTLPVPSVAVVLALCAAPLLASEPPRVSIRDTETVVFYGDSITEQNLYAAYLETFLLSRFPQKKIACFNFGWGGDTAAGGDKRFARDAGPVAPSLVFVNFGMNDGGYHAYQETTFRTYIDAQRALAATIKAAGARQVLFTSSPVDEYVRGDNGVYNDALSRMANGVVGLAGELKLPVIDLFHPMRDIIRTAREREPGSTMIPDAVHPNAVGHLVMAYLAFRQIDAPPELGDIVVAGGQLRGTRGVTPGRVEARDGGLEFDMTLPFLPFYVPPEARKALALVPLEDELNRFRLRVEDADDEGWVLSVDGVTTGTFSARELRDGVDLALLDKAPWCAAGRSLWETAQMRWQKHFEAWRRMGIDKPAAMMPDLASFEPLARAERAYADDLGRALGTVAQPRTYHVGLWHAGERVAITSVEVSPAYPLEVFDKAYPPEVDPGSVAWKVVPFQNDALDLGKALEGPTNVVSYARLRLEAASACTLHLSMGSDDGLAVVVNGKRVFSHDVLRSLKAGEDETDVALAQGPNEILFMVTQGAGDYALSVDADVRGTTRVTQIAPQ
jgi:lysophospholipase L1-like esterase